MDRRVLRASRAWTTSCCAQYHEGLIALSACLAGEDAAGAAAQRLRRSQARRARIWRKSSARINYYLELQDHGLPEQKQVAPGIIRLANETGIPLVVTNDAHYLQKEDSRMHHILICIQTNHTVEDDDTMEFGSDEFYLKSEDEMRALFPSRPDAADNTAKIAERCNVEFEFGHTKLPHFDVPNGEDHAQYFRAPVLRRAAPPLRRKSAAVVRGAAGIRAGHHRADGVCRLLPDRARFCPLREVSTGFLSGRGAAPARGVWRRTASASPASTR